MVKILRAEEIWDHYNHLPDDSGQRRVQSGKTTLFYNIYDLNDELTHMATGASAMCEPIISSIELSCCCFAEKLDQMICHDDEPTQLAAPAPLVGDIQFKVFQVSCDLFHLGKSKLVDQTDRDEKEDNRQRSVSVYLGLSFDYINQTLPQFTDGFTTDNHNECTLKMNFMCVMANTVTESSP